MVPLNLVESITRTFSLLVRLFGNMMSGVFVIGIVLSLVGLLVPVPLMALELLTGAVQAYIFSVLAMVFIGGAVGEAAHTEGSKDMNWIEIASILGAALAVSFGADRSGPGRGPRGRRGDGRHRTPAGGRRHAGAHPVRRPGDDRDHGDLLSGHGAAAAVRQPIRRGNAYRSAGHFACRQ